MMESERRHVVFFVGLSDSNSEIVDYLMKSHDLFLQVTVEVRNLKRKSMYSVDKNRKIGASILNLRNIDEFEIFFDSIRPDDFLYDGHFIIFYETANEAEKEKIFIKFWKMYIYNVNILATNPNDSNLISLFTFMPFRDGSCENTKAIRINEFNRTSLEWKTNEYFPRKFIQFYRCPIRFGCYENAPDIVIERSASNETLRFGGINFDIVKMLSDELNATLNATEYYPRSGVIYPNKTATGMVKVAMDNEVDVIFASIQTDRSQALSMTGMVYRDSLVIVVPPPFPMDPMAKMFLPFTFTSWMAIGTVALLACGTVKIVEFTPKIFHEHVVGSEINRSVLDVWNMFLGGSLPMLPRADFPRFFLANFLMFTLIIRSLYQGAVFDILKRDVSAVELNTIDDIIENGLTFYIYPTLAARIEGSRIMQRYVYDTNRYPHDTKIKVTHAIL